MTALDCVVGAGSNLGDRRLILAQAVAALGSRTHIARVSSVYETEPVGGPAQPHHLNLAIRLQWNSSPRALLVLLQNLESRFGRVRDVRWGPRTLDLDLLWIAGVAVRDEELTVPHPRLGERAFALVPLLEVAPDAVHPETGEPLSKLRPSALGDVKNLGHF